VELMVNSKHVNCSEQKITHDRVVYWFTQRKEEYAEHTKFFLSVQQPFDDSEV
jgi:hypothetical protein